MKKAKMITYILLYVSESLLLAFAIPGLRLDPNCYVHMSLGIIISVSAAILGIKEKSGSITALRKIFDFLLIPLAFVNSVLGIMEADGYWEILAAVYALVTFGCCLVISLSNSGKIVLKIILAVLSVLLSLLLLVLAFLSFFAYNAVVMTAESPSGRYYAEVIDNDQGALGGNTYVHAVKRVIKTPLFSISNPELVYEGSWGEFKDMEISWKNDECLVINGEEYLIE